MMQVVDPMTITLILFVLGMGLLGVLYWAKSYELWRAPIGSTTFYISVAIIIMGMAIGVFLLNILQLPNHLLLEEWGELESLWVTFFAIAFMASMIAGSLVIFLRRGGS